MRAMWHFIAFGRTLGNHWYRGLKDGKETVIDVDSFINKRLQDESNCTEDDYEQSNNDVPEHEEHKDDLEDDGNIQKVLDEFMNSWTKYGEKVVSELTRNNTNPELIKAVKSTSTMMIKSMNCKTETLIDKLIWFGKPKHTKIVRGKVRVKMNVQPTTVTRSKLNGAKRRGRKVTTKGRPHKSKQDILVLDDGTTVPAQPKLRKNKPRAIHKFKYSLGKNIPPPRRHDRQ